MGARVIDGIAIAREIREELSARVEFLRARSGVVPGLAVVLVGDEPASQVYVRNKQRACAQVGITSIRHDLPATVTTAELMDLIQVLNRRDDIHGILVQLPLPPHVNLRQVLEAIEVTKDVDGFHLYNIGGLVVGHPVFPPCTPYGVMEMLAHEGIDVAGQNVVVVGASNIVGKPLGLMLMRRDATVSICHARTRDLAQFTRLADVLVVAAGVPGLVKPEMVQEGAVVIDVGINRVLGSTRVVGDVDFEGVRQKASCITPVPGGVGPMTVTMLLKHTVISAERAASVHDETHKLAPTPAGASPPVGKAFALPHSQAHPA